MQSRCSHRYPISWALVALAILMPFAITGCGDEPGAEGGSSGEAAEGNSSQRAAMKSSPSYFTGEVIEAWEQAGAQAGWIRQGQDGRFYFREGTKAGYSDGLNLPSDLPAFQVRTWQEGLIAELPAPAVAFALDLSPSRVTDESLKGLAMLKNLQLLNLDNTRVGDAGIKELTGLKGLRALNLHNTNLTDAGLKDLAELKNLASVDLNGVRVSGDALFQLKQALPDCTVYRRN